MERINYPAKLLLFGEYTILKGSKALAMPLSLFGGRWVQEETHPENIEAKAGLQQLLKYLMDLVQTSRLSFQLAVEELANAVEEGWYFVSNIPMGYGLGSSGALSAAVYDRFYRGEPITDWSILKQQLAQIEACFHGASSGIDPLICLLNKAVLMRSKTELEGVELPDWKTASGNLFLLNTHLPRETAPLVQLFQEKCQDHYYNLRCQSELIPQTDNAIHAFLNRDEALLFDTIHEIGHFQYRYFDAMIPKAFRTVWLDGLSSDLFKLKLCGAGGGGFILGFTKDWSKTQELLADYELLQVFS